MRKPRIVQHSFGARGSGGPVGALSRVLASNMADRFDFCHVAQRDAAGGLNLRLAVLMAKQMRQFRPDMAHVRGLGNEGFHGVIAARLAFVPKILVSVHGSVSDLSGPVTPRRWIVSHVLEPLTLRLATHIVTVCDAARAKPVLQATSRKLVGSVYNGVDPIYVSPASREAKRQELLIDDEDVVVVIVARLVLDKGHLDLFQALKLIDSGQTAKLQLLVVGDGPDRELIKETARSVSGVRIRFMGRRHDVPEILGASDIAVLPSWHENMSNALLESMAAGVPVIATSVGGNPEVVSRGGGVLVPPRDPKALALALAELTHDPDTRSRLSREGRAVIASGFTVEHMTARLGEVYETILTK